jgi:hypothetical protein
MNNRRLVCLTISLAMLSLLASNGSAAEPKKLLVVTVTTGFRHSSIPMAEKVLAELAEKSKRFTVDYVREPRPRPKRPAEPKPMPNEADEAFKARKQAFDQEMETVKKADAVWLAEVTQVLAEKMSPSALANYDGVVFANTTGDLPLPDKDAFVAWIRSGRGFIGTHSATDTFHNYKPYLEMIGGEFDGHPWHQPVTRSSKLPTKSTNSKPIRAATRKCCSASTRRTPIAPGRTPGRARRRWDFSSAANVPTATTRLPGSSRTATGGSFIPRWGTATRCG